MTKEFVEQNYRLIQYVASKVGSKLSNEDREDLINDTVVKLLDSKTDVIEESASAYVNHVMKNLLIDKGRVANTDALNHADSLDAPIDKEEPDGMTMHETVPDRDVSNYAVKHEQAFKRVCAKLPYMQGRMMYMRYFLGMTPQQIADDLGYVKRTVESTLYRAKQEVERLGYNVQY